MGDRPSGSGNGSRRRLHAIGYDEHQDLLEIAVGFSRGGDSPLRFLIASPRNVDVAESDGTRTILVEDAELAVARVLALFAPPVPRPPVGVDPAARIAISAWLGDAVADSVRYGDEQVRPGAGRCVPGGGAGVDGGVDRVLGRQ